MAKQLKLRLLHGRFSVCRLEAREKLPSWAYGSGDFLTITRTPGELSIVCAEGVAPEGCKCERGWRIFQFEGPLDFALTGVLVAVAQPLADARISIFAVSTYDSDFVMVKEVNVDRAIQALTAAGHTITPE